jgi:hypothetical protein
MEPRIQYAQTTDGVSIAYWTLGEGMPFISMPPAAFSHVQLEWRVPEARRWYFTPLGFLGCRLTLRDGWRLGSQTRG